MKRSLPMLVIATMVATMCVPPGAAAATPNETCGRSAPPTRSAEGPSRVIWIWFENTSYSEALGTASPMSYLRELSRACAVATSWKDRLQSGPSKPQYVIATSGANCSDGGIRNADPDGDRGVSCVLSSEDPAPACSPVSCPGALAIPSLLTQLDRRRGTPWMSLQEGMLTRCSATSAGRYVARHNPPRYFRALRLGAPSACSRRTIGFPRTVCRTPRTCTIPRNNNPLLELVKRDALPQFAFVTPDVCNDGHDACDDFVDRRINADAWLAAWMPRMLAMGSVRSGETVIFVMWDEASTFGDSIPNVIVSARIPAGARVRTPIDHLDALGFVQDVLGLPRTGCARLTDRSTACPPPAAHPLVDLLGFRRH
jgi:hypothetical protein